MALTGNLRDFDLSYIFQIIAQEGKTGELHLSAGTNEAFVVFERGRIISASSGTKTLKKALLTYLVDIKRTPYSAVRRLADQMKDNLKGLADQIVAAKYISTPELSRFVEVTLEDLACSLFLWKDGTYRFDVRDGVDKYRINDVALPAEAITMEAARRVDEWERVRPHINPLTVFVFSDSPDSEWPGGETDPLDDPSEYLCSYLDGSTSVEYICQHSFLSDFRVYETLNMLMQQQRIVALSDKLSLSINEARRREVKARKLDVRDVTISSIIVALIMVLLLIISAMVPNSVIRREKRTARREQRAEVQQTMARQKSAVFTLYYLASKGHEPLTVNMLSSEKLLSPRDIVELGREVGNASDLPVP